MKGENSWKVFTVVLEKDDITCMTGNNATMVTAETGRHILIGLANT